LIRLPMNGPGCMVLLLPDKQAHNGVQGIPSPSNHPGGRQASN
jgi:hypothetical protein